MEVVDGVRLSIPLTPATVCLTPTIFLLWGRRLEERLQVFHKQILWMCPPDGTTDTNIRNDWRAVKRAHATTKSPQSLTVRLHCPLLMANVFTWANDNCRRRAVHNVRLFRSFISSLSIRRWIIDGRTDGDPSSVCLPSRRPQWK